MSRIAVVSTPRSGNTWLRGLVADLIGADQSARHRPKDFDWEALPEDAVIQLHWHPTPAFRQLLAEHDFSVLTIARHPCDVLLSILHFCRHEAATDQWLDGQAGDERGLRSARPSSAEVVDYALSERFRALASVSPAWHGVADAEVRYEDLVKDPAGVLLRATALLGLVIDQERLEMVIRSKSLEAMKPTSTNHHYWQGRPGIWRQLLPEKTLVALRPTLEQFARPFNYDLGGEATTAAAANALWDRLRADAPGGGRSRWS
jgi:LPS sulfotransferase NodH